MSTPSSASVPPADSAAPAHRYTAALADAIETRWQQTWAARQTFRMPNPGQPGFDASRPKFYCLDMFPYPSGAGLHVGHPEGYTATDILCRYKRHKGFNVLHPMGWDAFGLPAEQYAIQTGVHPAKTTKQSIDTFRRQLQRFGFCYDWSREVGTIDPEYYRWTQWIFLQVYDAWFDAGTPDLRAGSASSGRARPIAELVAQFQSGVRPARFNPGATEISDADKARDLGPWNALDARTRHSVINSYRLAYQGTTTVNWCPALGTVLANDEVIDGRSERGGHPVLRKPLSQWMFRITTYADRLLAQLDTLHWPESTKTMQREWIGRSQGAEIEFAVRGTPDLRAGRTVDDLYNANVKVLKHPTFIPRDPYPPGAHGSVADLMSSRRFLPHHRLEGATYFVTWRAQQGIILNEDERLTVLSALQHFDETRARVIAAVVMPDHVHWLLQPANNEELGKLVSSVKQYSATKINRSRGTSGSLWVPEAFDHIVRDERYLAEFVNYIIANPLKAGIVDTPSQYRSLYVAPVVLAGNLGNSPGPEVRGTPSTLTVFTTRPDTLFGATYMVVAPEHPLCRAVIERHHSVPDATRTALAAYVTTSANRSDVDRQEAKTKTGVFTGLHATNPATGKPIPIWAADYVLMGYGTGAIMAVPAHDERDWEFAETFTLPIVQVVRDPHAKADAEADAKASDCFDGLGIAVNSSGPDLTIDGLPTLEAKAKVIAWLEARGIGRSRVNYKFRDWTFSRQRYWGEPFPIVFDDAGQHYPVSAKALPVALPDLPDYRPVESDDPQPLLAKATGWVRTTAGAAGVDPSILPPHTPVTRETNTMPGSAGSSWYFLRYCDPANTHAPIDRQVDAYWMNVDFYMGGSEHTVGHLLYSRFWQNVLHDLGHVAKAEPFQRLFHQGMITSFAYERADK
ncbi:MAG: class I tRNA ligase family protein, partial [Phycisphaerales bacterium]|nr:class I tRNA ligase family protein [Phycisphaerales bacterium]